MNDYESIEWREFKFIEVFEINNGYYNKKPPIEENGDIPFIGATNSNNGITEFYSLETIDKNSKTGSKANHKLEKKIFEGNAICVTNNGSVGYAYYQKHDFTCSHDVNPLYLKNYDLNKYIALFLIAAIEKQRVCFQYSRKWRPERMVKSRIMLPVNKLDEPDYKFMESYIKKQKNFKRDKYSKFIQNKIEELKYKDISSLKEIEWKQVSLETLFSISIGKSINGDEADDSPGRTPYITRKESNNGLNGFIDFNNSKLAKDFPVITIGNETAKPFVQTYQFFTGTKVNILKSKDYLSEYVLHFIAGSIEKQKGKFNYSFTANSTRLKKLIVLLPIDNKGNINYEYMEQYIKNIMIKKYNQSMEHI